MIKEGDELASQETADSSADETKQRILRHAAEVFAEKGYARATTRALASAAGVNEVTLFRHFGSKEKLFASVLDEFAAPAMTTALETQLTGEYRQDLLTMGRLLVKTLFERASAVRLMLCEAAHFPELQAVLAQNPRQLRLTLARYLEQKMAQGQVRPLHAEAAAQAFWGMFFAYGISLGLLAEPLRPEIASEELVVHFVDIFVRGTIKEE